jgi:PAS domain S-box-containing protein
VTFLGLFLLTLGVVGVAAYASTRGSITEALFDQLRATSALKEGELNRWVAVQRELLEVIALQPDVRAGAENTTDEANVGQLSGVASLVAENSRDLKEVFIMAAAGGRVVASSRPERVNTFHVSDPFFVEGRSRSKVQEVYPSPETGQPQITVAVPIRNANRETMALVAAHLNLDRVDSIVHGHLDLYATSEAYLVTGTNEFVSADRFGLSEFRRGVHSSGIDSAVAGETGVAMYEDYKGTQVIGAYRWIPDREIALLVEVSQEEAFSPARALLRRILMVGLGATLFLTIAVRWVASRMARPIAAVGTAAAGVAKGDFSVVAPVKGDDEVGELARSFNSMTSRLRELYSDLQEQIVVTTQTVSALEESRSLIRSILDNSNALIAVTAPDGEVQLMNQAFLELLDFRLEEVEGRYLRTLLPIEIRTIWVEAKVAAFEERRVVEREIRWKTDQGTRTYLCVWFPLTDERATPFGIGMVATDFTERKRVEEERLRLEVQMRHAQKLESLGVLAGGIAHDFNNILAAILGHAELAAQCAAEDPAQAKSHLDQVLAATQRGSGLTNQMLAYAGRASFRVEILDLNRAIEEMSTFMEVSVPKKIRLETRLSEGSLPVRADPAQLSQVVMNLITNAAQAIGDETGTVEVSTSISAPSHSDPMAVVKVRDTGVGMDTATRERIFDPFFSTKERGRGLGLAAVIGIVWGLDGTIDVESQPGEGTTFTVFLPLDVADQEGSATDHVVAAEPLRTGGTVLVVDDEEAVRNFTVLALERRGFEVLEAEDGVSAIEVLEAEGHRIDVVVLDLSMPGLGGKEVFERLRLNSPCPVLFISGYDPADTAKIVSDTEAVRFLQKPFRPTMLVDEVQALLDGGYSSTG